MVAYTFDTPVGKEFVGFYIGDSTNAGTTTRLAVYYRDIDCAQSSNLVFEGLNSNIGSKTIPSTGSSTN